jgi:hypothetical protein
MVPLSRLGESDVAWRRMFCLQRLNTVNGDYHEEVAVVIVARRLRKTLRRITGRRETPCRSWRRTGIPVLAQTLDTTPLTFAILGLQPLFK